MFVVLGLLFGFIVSTAIFVPYYQHRIRVDTAKSIAEVAKYFALWTEEVKNTLEHTSLVTHAYAQGLADGKSVTERVI